MSEISEAMSLDAHDVYNAYVLLCMAGDDDAPLGVDYVPAGFDRNTQINVVPWQLVRAALGQFYGNLLRLCDSDSVELVHHARIGWRRLRSSCRLLRRFHDLPEPPPTGPLLLLLEQLRALRECHVARYDILPHMASDSQAWHAFAEALDTEARTRLKVVRVLLEDPAVGQTLWKHVVWLGQLRDHARASPSQPQKPQAIATWATHQVEKIHRAFERAQSQCQDVQTQHQARIWAKRLRYAVEDFEGVLPQTAIKWHKAAAKAQAEFGAQRDLQTTANLAKRHGAPKLADKWAQALFRKVHPRHSNRRSV
jgi:CHAD domain-containing protein